MSIYDRWGQDIPTHLFRGVVSEFKRGNLTGPEAIQKLADQGVVLDATEQTQVTTLINAVTKDHFEDVALLFEVQAYTKQECLDSWGVTE